MVTAIIVFAVVSAASAVQSVAGMGFSLMAVPLLIPLIGTVGGVTLVNLASGLTSLVITATCFRQINWAAMWKIGLPALITVAPSVLLIVTLTTPLLNIMIGALLLICVVALATNGRLTGHWEGMNASIVAGGASGFMNTCAGVGGPPLAVYARTMSWTHEAFVATAQPYFLMIDSAALAAKYALLGGGTHGGGFIGAQVIACAAGCAAGIALGRWLVRRVPANAAKRIVIIVSSLGAASTLGSGIIALLT